MKIVSIREKIEITAAIVSLVIPAVYLLWFVISLRVDAVQADIDNIESQYKGHLIVHQQMLDSMPDKALIEQQYQFISDELVKINTEIDRCRETDKEMLDKIYKILVNQK